MARLGGWTRIGIVLSVLWAVYALSEADSRLHRDVRNMATYAQDECYRAQKHDPKIDCRNAYDDEWFRGDREHRDNWSLTKQWVVGGMLPLSQLDTADRQMPTEALAVKEQHLKEKLAKLKEQMARRDAHEKRMLSPDEQISLTDPDSRSMAPHRAPGCG